MGNEEKRAEAAGFHLAKAEELRSRPPAEGGGGKDVQEQIAFLEALADEFSSGFDVTMPSLTFSDELALNLGDLTLRLVFFGKGHSPSDVIVHIPQEKVVVTGGACNRFFPRIKERTELDDLRRSIAVLDDLLASPEPIQFVVPAHMELLGAQDLERLRDYYRDVLSGTTAAHAEGASLAEAQERLALDRRFPYMRDAEAYRGSREELHEANVTAVWKLVEPQ
jgi:glyoxylase-like metal-dependent hydrolase (beta-lactamase superfamily II)